MDYVEPKIARDMPGMRLALTAGAPGPWSESAKGIFHVKKIDYVPVLQVGGGQNEDLVAWTGTRNAPVAVYNDEPPKEAWMDILMLAERIAPEPRLVPDDAAERAMMFGLSHEICGEDGYAWNLRLIMFHDVVKAGGMNENFKTMADSYGYTEQTAQAAPEKTAKIVRLLATQLHEQKTRNSRYFVGSQLSALDIYWACFCAMIRPMPQEKCPMSDQLRYLYNNRDAAVDAAIDPVLIDHRDYIYETYLELPMDF